MNKLNCKDIDNIIESYNIRAANLSCEVDALRKEMTEIREHLKSVCLKYSYVMQERDCALEYIGILEKQKETL